MSNFAQYGADLDGIIRHLAANGADGHSVAGERLADLIDRIARDLYTGAAPAPDTPAPQAGA